jgi:hypothetical protein
MPAPATISAIAMPVRAAKNLKADDKPVRAELQDSSMRLQDEIMRVQQKSPHTTAFAWSACARMVPVVLWLPLCGCFLGDRGIFVDSRLPARVQQISFEGQRQNAELSDVYREIRAEYGEPTRQNGTTEQWTVADGVLTYSPSAGVFFVSPQGEMIRVVRKQNPLGQSLFGSYGMATRPDARHDHTRYWLGGVDLRVDATYDYKDSHQFPDERADQGNNFFMQHPSGTFQLEYLKGYGPETLLESIHGHKRLAKLTFRGTNGAQKTYYIARKVDLWGVRKLVFESDEPMEFEMDVWWDTRWQ